MIEAQTTNVRRAERIGPGPGLGLGLGLGPHYGAVTDSTCL